MELESVAMNFGIRKGSFWYSRSVGTSTSAKESGLTAATYKIRVRACGDGVNIFDRLWRLCRGGCNGSSNPQLLLPLPPHRHLAPTQTFLLLHLPPRRHLAPTQTAPPPTPTPTSAISYTPQGPISGKLPTPSGLKGHTSDCLE